MTMKKIAFGCFIAISALTMGAAANDYNTNFDGTWRGQLQTIDPQIHSNALPDLTGHPELIEFALEISNGEPSVYMFFDNAWNEVKPGRFAMAVHKTNAIIASIDSSFSEDGRSGWVETWNITLTEKDDHSIYVYWVRAVNNPNLPDGSDQSARFFVSRFGSMERSSPVLSVNALQASTTAQSSRCEQSALVCKASPYRVDGRMKFYPKVEQE